MVIVCVSVVVLDIDASDVSDDDAVFVVVGSLEADFVTEIVFVIDEVLLMLASCVPRVGDGTCVGVFVTLTLCDSVSVKVGVSVGFVRSLVVEIVLECTSADKLPVLERVKDGRLGEPDFCSV